MQASWKGLGLLLLAVAFGASAQDDEELQQIDVIGATPFSGSEIDADRYPTNVQTSSAQDIEDAETLNTATFLNQELGSVHVNDGVNNPFQPDLKFRGYTASPLLGLPQGLSVYQDGVRVNEPFGDTVNFDLIPDGAIQSVDLIPGSNPLFGQNTLGGALNFSTKTGFSDPGLNIEAFGGSFDRFGGSISYGGSEGDNAWFFLAQGLEEDGWRDFSDSQLRQFFGQVTSLTDNGEINLSVTGAANTLRGNGAVPVTLAEAEGRDAIFTFPDETSPDLLMINLRGVRDLSNNVSLAWGGYYRRSDVSNFNGDGSEFSQCEDDEEPAFDEDFLCTEEIEDDEEVQELVTDTNGDPVPFNEDIDIYGTENTSRTEQDGFGLNFQLRTPGLFTGELISGVTYDYATIDFRSGQEIAELTDDRGTTGLNIFTGEAVTELASRNSNIGVFALHRLPITDSIEWTLGGRYNLTTIDTVDRTPAFATEGDNSIGGDNEFKRLNLTTGGTWQVTPGLTFFASAGQASRAPTPLELSCANPDSPCRLPNGFVDDPPLEQVVSTHYELGARGGTQNLSWRAALFSSTNQDDIIFQAVSLFESFFDNVGDTRRQGVELGTDWNIVPTLRLSANYTYVQAEFRDDFVVSSPNHPIRAEADAAEAGEDDDDDEGRPAPRTQQVESGDRIPLVPEHIFNVGLDWRATDRLNFGLDVEGNSDQIFRGDESNTDSEQIDGFAIVNAHAEFALTDWFSAFVRATNLLDTDYETFGVYGEPDEVLEGEQFEDNPRFIGPGAPRGIWGGIRVQL